MIADEMDKSGRGEESFTPAHQRRLKLWHIGVGLLCLAIAGLLAMRWHWRYEFHRRIEAIRAAGFPVTPQELDAAYPWPASGENAAFWVTGAAACLWKLTDADWRRLERIVGWSDDRPRSAEPLVADLSELLERHVESNSQALKLLHEAAALAECRYPIDLSPGRAHFLTHLSDVREGCLLLCLEAVRCVEHGDPNGAVRALEASLHVARSLDREPFPMSRVTRMWLPVWTTSVLERALNRVVLADEQLASLCRDLCDIHTTKGAVRAFAGMRCMALALFEEPQAADRQFFNKLPPVALLEMYHALGLSAREGTVFLDYIDQCLRINRLPPWQRPGAIEALDAAVRDRRSVFLREIAQTAMMAGGEVRSMAQIHVATTALALQRYRLARKELPETLDQLVPAYLAAVPVDPFDGVPLRYRRTDRGFVVYSVGEDGTDDGGQGHRPTEGGDTGVSAYDIAFTVER